MNKIGIISGIIVFVIAIVLYIITISVQNSKDKENTSNPSTSIAETTSVSTTSVSTTSIKEENIVTTTSENDEDKKEVADSSSSITTTPTITMEKEEPTEEIVEDSIFMEIDTESLPDGKIKEEVGIVAKKGIYLIEDELYYMTEILMTDNTVLKYFVSQDGYEKINSGDKVRVKYTNYVTKNGKKFSIVDNISLIG